MGCEAVIDRQAEGYRFWSDEHTQDEGEWRRFGKKIRALIGDDPDIVFEHPGRQTMGASVFIAASAAARSSPARRPPGYMVEFDNRHFWMKLKRIVSLATSPTTRRRGQVNQLIGQGAIQPVLSAGVPARQVGDAALKVHRNEHEGKIGVLCLAPERGPRHRRPRAAGADRRGQDHPVPPPRRLTRALRPDRAPERPEFARGQSAGRQHVAMLLTEIDHVAIAVRDLEAAIDYYRRAFGAEVAPPRDRRVRRRRGGALKVADSYIQLPTPTRADSPIAKSIEKRGEGLHHIGYRVDDCAEALAAMVAAGATPIDQAPRPGSRGTTVAFVHPKGSFGTLIELVQENPAPDHR